LRRIGFTKADPLERDDGAAMKKVLLIVLLVLVCIVGAAGYAGYRFISFLISCNGCVYEYNGGTVVHGSGHAVTQSRPVTSFSAIHVAGTGSILIDRTGTESLTITADDNLLPLFTSAVKDGVLNLGVAEGKSFQGKAPVYRITAATLRDIEIAGAGDVTANDLTGDSFLVKIAGSGDVRLAGEINALTVSVAGSGDVDASALKAKSATVSVAGSGGVTINASDTLDARVSGSGEVRYLGSPKVTTEVAGSGSVKQK
jgi:hypothetical protein